MPRSRAFEPEQALAQAMVVFWQYGFEASSMDKLLRAMGIGKGSFYKTFGDKRTAYVEALKLYGSTELAATWSHLADPVHGDGADRVRDVLERATAAAAHADDKHGCFLCNAMIDQAPVDADVRALSQTLSEHLHSGFTLAIRDASGARTWSDIIVGRVAESFVSTYIGLWTLVRAGQDGGMIQRIIETKMMMTGIKIVYE